MARNQRTKIDVSILISSITVPLMMLVLELVLLAQSVAISGAYATVQLHLPLDAIQSSGYNRIAIRDLNGQQEQSAELTQPATNLSQLSFSEIQLARQFQETIKLINDTVDQRAFEKFNKLLHEQNLAKTVSKIIFNDTLFSKRALQERVEADGMNISIYAGQLTNRPEVSLVVLRNQTTVLVTRRANKYYYWKNAQTCLAAVIFCMIVIGNISIINRLKSCRRRRSNVNYFIVQLAIADLCVGLFNVPVDTFIRISQEFPYGSPACIMYKYFSILFLYSSTYMLVALSIDRWEAVVRPLAFTRNRSRGHYLVAGAWLFACIIATPATFRTKVKEMDGYNQCYIQYNDFEWKCYMIYVTSTVLIVPALIIAVCYTSIVYTIWKKARLVEEQNRRLEKELAVGTGGADAKTRITSSDIDDDIEANNHEHASSRLVVVSTASAPIGKNTTMREMDLCAREQRRNQLMLQGPRSNSVALCQQQQNGSTSSTSSSLVGQEIDETTDTKIRVIENESSGKHTDITVAPKSIVINGNSQLKQEQEKEQEPKKRLSCRRHDDTTDEDEENENENEDNGDGDGDSNDGCDHKTVRGVLSLGSSRVLYREDACSNRMQTNREELEMVSPQGSEDNVDEDANQMVKLASASMAKQRMKQVHDNGRISTLSETNVGTSNQLMSIQSQPLATTNGKSYDSMMTKNNNYWKLCEGPRRISKVSGTVLAATCLIVKKRPITARAQQHGNGLIPKARIKTVKMTFVIVLAFILCWAPFCMINLFAVFRLLEDESHFSTALTTLSMSLVHLNSAANPIIFWLFSSKRQNSSVRSTTASSDTARNSRGRWKRLRAKNSRGSNADTNQQNWFYSLLTLPFKSCQSVISTQTMPINNNSTNHPNHGSRKFSGPTGTCSATGSRYNQDSLREFVVTQQSNVATNGTMNN